MGFFQVVIFLGMCVAMALGHMCLLSPPQRGSMQGINKPAADDCGLVKNPCGGRTARRFPPTAAGGQNFTFTFQKNLDHYAAASPGYFSISLGDKKMTNFTEIARVPDKGEPSLYIYSLEAMIPQVTKSTVMTAQVRYVTNNPAALIFYQCSNLIVYPDN